MISSISRNSFTLENTNNISQCAHWIVVKGYYDNQLILYATLEFL